MIGDNETTIRQRIGSPVYVDSTEKHRVLFYQVEEENLLILFFKKDEVDIYSLEKIDSMSIAQYNKRLKRLSS